VKEAESSHFGRSFLSTECVQHSTSHLSFSRCPPSPFARFERFRRRKGRRKMRRRGRIGVSSSLSSSALVFSLHDSCLSSQDVLLRPAPPSTIASAPRTSPSASGASSAATPLRRLTQPFHWLTGHARRRTRSGQTTEGNASEGSSVRLSLLPISLPSPSSIAVLPISRPFPSVPRC
jgi:hypothetical protein